jgi:hypothetical protein
MKKLLTLIALAAFTVTAQAQHEEGESTFQPRIGITMSTVTDEEDAKMKLNLTYGIEFEYYVSDKLGLAAGVLFTNQGYQSDYYNLDNTKETMKLDNYYTAIPITVNYYLIEGLAIKAGIQPALRVKTRFKMGSEKLDLDDYLDLLFTNKEVTLNKFDLSIPVGLSYEYNRVTLDARYNIGLTKLYSGIDDSSRNSVITVTLGYKL